jgi:adenine-specific DNA methylase
VLTDPPYFDDVQYAELASLFFAWAQTTGLIASNVRLDLSGEAVANSRRATGVEHYQRLLERIMRETARTLRIDGSMILTFHNSDGRAWWALGRALGNAGFRIAALAVAHAENETDHAKRNRKSFSRDLVVECRLDGHGATQVATPAGSDEAGELLAAGLAVADLALQPTKQTYASFCTTLREQLEREPKLIRLRTDGNQEEIRAT